MDVSHLILLLDGWISVSRCIHISPGERTSRTHSVNGLLSNRGHRKLLTPVSKTEPQSSPPQLPTSEQLQSTRRAVTSSFAGILFGNPRQNVYGAKTV
jgi:hypothetical protein